MFERIEMEDTLFLSMGLYETFKVRNLAYVEANEDAGWQYIRRIAGIYALNIMHDITTVQPMEAAAGDIFTLRAAEETSDNEEEEDSQ